MSIPKWFSWNGAAGKFSNEVGDTVLINDNYCPYNTEIE